MEPIRRKKREHPLVALAKKYWFVAAGALALILAIVLVSGVISGLNKYKEPVKLQQKVLNAKTADKMYDATLEQLNGLGEKELKTILDILKQTKEGEAIQDSFIDAIAAREEMAGSNAKVKIKITDKEKMDESALENMQDHIDKLAERFDQMAQQLEENSSDAVDLWDISEKDVKKLVKAYKSLAKTFSKAKVTKGYYMELNMKMTGKQLDEPVESSRSYRVYKIGGKWVSEDVFDLFYYF